MKLILICADGAWYGGDQLDMATRHRRPIKVTKVAWSVLPCDPQGIDQIARCCDGIGTRELFDRPSGGAFVCGIEDDIRVPHRFIAFN